MSDLAHDHEGVTPPSSIHLPPTPPPTHEKAASATATIRRLIANQVSWKTNQRIPKVDKKLWEVVETILQEHPKIRYAKSYPTIGQPLRKMEYLTLKRSFNYFPSRELLILRMASRVHELLLSELGRRISEQLLGFSRRSGPAAAFIGNIKDAGSPKIKAKDKNFGDHVPDKCFIHLHQSSPSVVVEVAHSQKGPRLFRVAEDYILGSNLTIGVVLGINIEYGHSQKATFSVFRAVQEPDESGEVVWVTRATVDERVFRNEDGSHNPDDTAGIRLRFEDFADEKNRHLFKDIDEEIFVSCKELYQYLQDAETNEQITKSSYREPSPHMKKRRRPPTPDEQLDEHDENTYVRDETLVSKRQELEDSSYDGSGSDRT